MIQKQTIINTVSSGTEREGQFGMRAEDMPGIFKILRSAIYSDKPLTVLREYFANSLDSHEKAGNSDQPIEITMPTVFSMDLKIRDFGLGLSEDDVYNVFTQYGYSTKKQSKTSIGCLGIGSKSAFCYTDNFTVISFFNGIKSTYLCYLDNSGLGKINTLTNEPTDSPNGLEIVVPIKQNDIKSFIEVAKKLFIWSKVKPIIYGNEELSNYLKNYQMDVVKESYNWRLYKLPYSSYSNNDIICLMGNIPYPINLNHFDRFNKKHAFFMKNGVGVVLEVELGAVSFSANRETLEYDSDTIAYLHKSLEDVYDEMVEEFNKALALSPTYWDALINYSQYSAYFSGIHPTYKGQKIEDDCFYISNEMNKITSVWSDFLRTFSYKYDANKGVIRSSSGANIRPSKSPKLFINKGNFPQSTLRDRFLYYMRENNFSLYIHY